MPRSDIVESAASLQLCVGQPAGCEAAAHSIEKIFQEERDAPQHQYICPPMATYIRNCYCAPSRLFFTGGCEIDSAEGTTHGDPLILNRKLRIVLSSLVFNTN